MREKRLVAKDGPDPVDVHVGQRIRLRRKQLVLSQEKLGEALGLTFQQIQKYERGANRVSASMLFRTAKKLQVRIAYFFEGLEGQSEEDGVGPADIPAMQALLAVPEVALIHTMPRENQLVIGKLIAAMSK